ATAQNKICLYVGKTTNLRDRISKHLKLGSPTLWNGKKRNSGTKPNTVSQMRIGLETVFDKDMLAEIIENVSVSWAEMGNYSEAINRFFLEDKMISHYSPLFNIDVER
ncbi:MAG: GIY-YIG nuclease family protein, partial [Gillisia sp.]